MTNTNTIKIGVMPGRIEEYALEAGVTFNQALEIAGLNAEGYEVKADGNTITDLNSVVGSEVNVVLLTKRVKGNNTVKIGVMPGRIEEYALDANTTVAQALEQAGLNAEGYEVKADGTTVTDLNQTISGANVILLTKKVKGNASIKIGVMPGRIEEYVLEDGTTVAQALEIAGLSADGYEVKQDGNTVEDLNSLANGNVILLTKRVKGN